MRIAAAAASYQAYTQAAVGLQPDFTDGAGVAQSLRTASSYRSEDLIAGSIAYGAVIALQEPGFVASIRSLAVDPNGRRRVVASRWPMRSRQESSKSVALISLLERAFTAWEALRLSRSFIALFYVRWRMIAIYRFKYQTISAK